MNVLTLRMNTWQDARILANQLSGCIFRGQQDASWELSTALQRAGQQGQGTSFLLTGIEKQIIEEFQRRAHRFLPDPPLLENLIEWLALIQHSVGQHGCSISHDLSMLQHFLQSKGRRRNAPSGA